MRRYLRAIRKSINCNIKKMFENLGLLFLISSIFLMVIGLCSNNDLLFALALFFLALPGGLVFLIIMSIEIFDSFMEWCKDFINRVKSNLEE